ncbi:MAG: amidase [bacterium]
MKQHLIANRFFYLLLLSLIIATSCGEQKPAGISEFPLDIEELTIGDVHTAYQNGTFTISQLTRAYLDRIEEIDRNGPGLNAVITVNPDALDIAARLDREWKEGKIRGPMHGIPVLLKDNIDTHDKMPNTAGSRALSGSYPLKDSYIVSKLREAGAVILGKTNLSEWANFRGERSSSGWSGVGGQTHNPYVLDRNPCGSSSGSGVAVSANLCMVAIGTETDGSIVCPANSNGIVGIKPTVGLLSRSGIIPISFTQDTPGPMARTVSDAAICLGTMVGVDSSDTKTYLSEGNYLSDYSVFLNRDGLKGKRIGVLKEPTGKHYKVDSLFFKAVDFIRGLGAEIIDVESIMAENIWDENYQVLLYEFKDGLNIYLASLEDPRVENLADLIKFNRNDSIELSFYDQNILIKAQEKGSLDSREYRDALDKVHHFMCTEGLDKVMEKHNLDAVIAPTGSPAWKTDHVNGDSFILGSSSPAAMCGYPNITVPMGFVDGLPVGISFFGKAWSEPVLIEMAYAYEQGTKHRMPPQFLESDLK